MTYKKNPTYGTALGGCCSCVVSLCTAIYVMIIYSAFLFGRSYNSTSEQYYLSVTNPKQFNVTVSEVIPAFKVVEY